MEFITRPKTLPKQQLPELPEVYQIETVATCNLKCTMCPTRFFKREDNPDFLEVALLDKIIAQGDLDNSYFVELQCSGEPTLHPMLDTIISKVKATGVKVGLSTNGLKLAKNIKTLCTLDSITISLDSISNHHGIRKTKWGRTSIENLIHEIKRFLIAAEDSGTLVDIQVIELDGWEDEFEVIKSVFDGYKCNIRHYPNTFFTSFYHDYDLPVSKELCINPWMSASILCNGNVVPCCMALGDDYIYGNVRTRTLREIWAGDKVKEFRDMHTNKHYIPMCAKCYMRSPALFHWNMFTNNIRGTK